MSKSINYMKGLIKKFNDNGDYHIGDELSWALDDLELKEKEIQLLRALVVEARTYVKKYRQTNSDLVASETNRIFNWLNKTEKIKVD